MKRRHDLILRAMAEKSIDAIVMYNYGDMVAGVFKYATDASGAYPLTALLCAEGIAEQLKRRSSFRRVMKQRCEAAMAAGAKGVKIICKGRLGGAEMARRETQIMGSIPLQTLQAKVDYGYALSRTTYGAIGVRTWIYRGMFGEETQEARSARFGRRGRR